LLFVTLYIFKTCLITSSIYWPFRV